VLRSWIAIEQFDGLDRLAEPHERADAPEAPLPRGPLTEEIEHSSYDGLAAIVIEVQHLGR
jgi:hypothetical protein